MVLCRAPFLLLFCQAVRRLFTFTLQHQDRAHCVCAALFILAQAEISIYSGRNHSNAVSETFDLIEHRYGERCKQHKECERDCKDCLETLNYANYAKEVKRIALFHYITKCVLRSCELCCAAIMHTCMPLPCPCAQTFSECMGSPRCLIFVSCSIVKFLKNCSLNRRGGMNCVGHGRILKQRWSEGMATRATRARSQSFLIA